MELQMVFQQVAGVGWLRTTDGDRYLLGQAFGAGVKC